jgi:hypothetical protein
VIAAVDVRTSHAPMVADFHANQRSPQPPEKIDLILPRRNQAKLQAAVVAIPPRPRSSGNLVSPHGLKKPPKFWLCPGLLATATTVSDGHHPTTLARQRLLRHGPLFAVVTRD